MSPLKTLALGMGLGVSLFRRNDAMMSNSSSNHSNGIPAVTNSNFTSNSTSSEPNFYSTLVVIGDSYSDDGHFRAAKYETSFGQGLPYSNYGGRFTNGIVEVEYMVRSNTTVPLSNSSSDIALIDLAFSGAEVSNQLTPVEPTRPDTGMQVDYYLRGINNGTITTGNGSERVLHFIQIGINPIQEIWSDLGNNSSSSAIENSFSRINATFKALESQLETLDAGISKSKSIPYADYLVVGTPSLENTPFNIQLAKQIGGNLTILKELTESYNDQLSKFVNQEFKPRSNSSKVFYYDLHSLFNQFFAEPEKYNISPASLKSACYQRNGTVCADYKTALFFDTEHCNTQIHRLWADEYNSLVMSA